MAQIYNLLTEHYCEEYGVDVIAPLHIQWRHERSSWTCQMSRTTAYKYKKKLGSGIVVREGQVDWRKSQRMRGYGYVSPDDLLEQAGIKSNGVLTNGSGGFVK